MGAIAWGLGAHGCAPPTPGEAQGFTTSRYAGPMPLVVVKASPAARRQGIASWQLFRGKHDPILVAYSEDGEALKGLSSSVRTSAARALTVQARLNDRTRFVAARVVGSDRTAANRAISPPSQTFVNLARSDLLLARQLLHAELPTRASGTCDIDLTNAVLNTLQCMQTQKLGARACVTAALAVVTSARTCATPPRATAPPAGSAATTKEKRGSGGGSSSGRESSAKTAKTKRPSTASSSKKNPPRTPSKVDVSKAKLPANDPVIDSIYTPEYYAKRFSEAGGDAASTTGKDPFANPTIVKGGDCVTCGLDSPFAAPIMMSEGVCTTCEPTKEESPFADATIVSGGDCTTCGPTPTETDPFAGATTVDSGICATCSNTDEGGDVTASLDTGKVIAVENESGAASDEGTAEPTPVSEPAPDEGSSPSEGIETLLLLPRRRPGFDDPTADDERTRFT
jgi:hypothetical protein